MLFIIRIFIFKKIHSYIHHQKSENYDAGWHIPGGIIRFREKILDRVIKVAKNELNAVVKAANIPLAINQIILKNKRNRSHFISLLFECKIKSFKNKNKFNKKKILAGAWKWHKKMPKDLITPHKKIYKNLFY